MSKSSIVDFIGVGSGKCGSTWFFENVIQHPEIYDGNPKEINYFSDLFTQHSPKWYDNQFKGCTDDSLLKGEFSVTYMYHPESAIRIKENCPDAKIIAIVRDPIYRTFSDYLHAQRKGDIAPSLPFSEYIKDEKKLEFGCYTQYLKQFFDNFPADQIKVIVLEDFNENYGKGFREVFEFLGLKDVDFIPPGVEERRNQARSYRFIKLENLLVQTYRMLAKAGFTRLTETVKRSGIPELFRKFNTSKKPLPEIDDASKDMLKQYFATEKKFVSELTGSSLSAWQ